MGFPGISGSTRTDRTDRRDADPATPPAPPAPDWPKQATQQIVKVVDTVRDATTGKALTAARVVVYGTVLALLGIPLLVFVVLWLVRWTEGGLLWANERLQWGWLEHPIYLIYLLLGFAFLGAGLVLWRSANKAVTTAP